MDWSVKEYSMGANGKPLTVRFTNGKEARIPFYVDLSLQQYGNNEGEYFEYLETLRAQFEEEGKDALPGQPLRCQFPDGEVGQRNFESRMRMWESAVVSEEMHKRHTPPPQPRPVDPDFAALSSSNKKDREIAMQQLGLKNEISRLIQDATKKELSGETDGPRGSKELKAMAASLAKTYDATQRSHKYESQIKQDEAQMEEAEQMIETSRMLSPQEIETRRSGDQLVIECFDHESPKEFSYDYDDEKSPYDNYGKTGKGGICKIHHPGLTAAEVANSAKGHGMSVRDYLISKKGFYPEQTSSGEKPAESNPEPQEESGNDPVANMSQAEFEAQRLRDGAKPF